MATPGCSQAAAVLWAVGVSPTSKGWLRYTPKSRVEVGPRGRGGGLGEPAGGGSDFVGVLGKQRSPASGGGGGSSWHPHECSGWQRAAEPRPGPRKRPDPRLGESAVDGRQLGDPGGWRGAGCCAPGTLPTAVRVHPAALGGGSPEQAHSTARRGTLHVTRDDARVLANGCGVSDAAARASPEDTALSHRSQPRRTRQPPRLRAPRFPLCATGEQWRLGAVPGAPSSSGRGSSRLLGALTCAGRGRPVSPAAV